jgi:hypothetical protein
MLRRGCQIANSWRDLYHFCLFTFLKKPFKILSICVNLYLFVRIFIINVAIVFTEKASQFLSKPSGIINILLVFISVFILIVTIKKQINLTF